MACGGAAAGLADEPDGGDWSEGLDDVPGSEKFWSSLGPTVVEGAGALVGGDWPVLCASAKPGATRSPPANNTLVLRKLALIASACLIRRLSSRRRRPMPGPCSLFKQMVDERQRNPV